MFVIREKLYAHPVLFSLKTLEKPNFRKVDKFGFQLAVLFRTETYALFPFIVYVSLHLTSLPAVISYFNSVFFLISFLSCLLYLSHLGTFAKFRIATISFIMSVCPRVFVLPPARVKQLGCHRTNFHDISYFNIFRKSVEKFQVSLNSDKNNGYITWRHRVCGYIYDNNVLILLRMRNASDKSYREKEMPNNRFPKIVPFMR
jgi:hypothetical protein